MSGTSASAAEPIHDQHPRKRRKRSLSTPASPQLSAQLQLRRRSRSRAGSPATDAVNVPPLRVSARLARRIHPLINNRSSDIYTHLADPDDATNLLSEPPAGSIVLSTPNETVGSQSGRKLRGRRRKVVDLGNENSRRDLMEEWAQLRQSQGTIPLSGINKNTTCLSQTLPRETRKGNDPPAQREALTTGKNYGLSKSQTTIITDGSQSQERPHTVSSGGSLTRMDLENVASPVPPPDVENKQPTASNLHIDIEDPSTSFPDLGANKEAEGESTSLPDTTPNRGNGNQRTGSSPPQLSASPPREDSIHIKHMLPVTEPVELHDPLKDSNSAALSHTYSLDNNDIHFDSDEEFYMLDIPEIFALPWVSVTSHLYLPPGLGKLVSGMREQLSLAARARRRAEELYHVELSRRVSAEKTVEDLRTELAEKQKETSGSTSTEPRERGDGSSQSTGGS